MSNSISDIDHAEVLLVIGSNTTECHPIIGRRIAGVRSRERNSSWQTGQSN
jgi:predicted molibdopterin-dependent oxidoreductase YjgC